MNEITHIMVVTVVCQGNNHQLHVSPPKAKALVLTQLLPLLPIIITISILTSQLVPGFPSSFFHYARLVPILAGAFFYMLHLVFVSVRY